MGAFGTSGFSLESVGMSLANGISVNLRLFAKGSGAVGDGGARLACGESRTLLCALRDAAGGGAIAGGGVKGRTAGDTGGLMCPKWLGGRVNCNSVNRRRCEEGLIGDGGCNAVMSAGVIAPEADSSGATLRAKRAGSEAREGRDISVVVLSTSTSSISDSAPASLHLDNGRENLPQRAKREATEISEGVEAPLVHAEVSSVSVADMRVLQDDTGRETYFPGREKREVGINDGVDAPLAEG